MALPFTVIELRWDRGRLRAIAARPNPGARRGAGRVMTQRPDGRDRSIATALLEARRGPAYSLVSMDGPTRKCERWLGRDQCPPTCWRIAQVYCFRCASFFCQDHLRDHECDLDAANARRSDGVRRR